MSRIWEIIYRYGVRRNNNDKKQGITLLYIGSPIKAGFFISNKGENKWLKT